MLHEELIGLWHFDEASGTVSANAVTGGPSMLVHGGRFEPRRFGGALVLSRPDDHARTLAPPPMRAGSVCFSLRLDAAPKSADILDIYGTCSVMVDPAPGIGLIAQLGENILPSGKRLEPGRWYHVALTFSPDGAVLFLDGKPMAQDKAAAGGLTIGLNRHEQLTIGAGGERFTPFAVDELAVFGTCLSPRRVMQLALGDLEPSTPIRSQARPQNVRAKQFFDPADPTCGLQRAIDAAGPAGGQVTLEPGRYELRRPLMLSSRVTLVGDGGQTVLTSAAPLASALAAHTAEGAGVIRVEDPSMFSIGDAIAVRSDKHNGWHTTYAHIVAMEGGALRLSRPLINAYKTFDNAVAVTWFPLIVARRHHHVRIAGLELVGGGSPIEDVEEPVDFSCPALLATDCVDIDIEHCRVIGWPHDGFGIHGGSRVRLRDCTAMDCLGSGFMLNADLRHAQMSGNLAQRNRGDGLTVGDQVRDSIISANIFDANHQHGIGGLEDANLKTNLINANHCLQNRLGGLSCQGEHPTVTTNLVRGPAPTKRYSRRMF